MLVLFRSKRLVSLHKGSYLAQTTCCRPLQRCDSFTCNATASQFPDASKSMSYCDPTVMSSCDQGCCKQLQRCDSFTCAAPGTVSNTSMFSQYCDPNVLGDCQSMCCRPLQACATVTCSAASGLVPNNTQLMQFCDPLNGNECSTTCCRPLTQCSSYTCDRANGFTTNVTQSMQYCDNQNIEECQVSKQQSLGILAVHMTNGAHPHLTAQCFCLVSFILYLLQNTCCRQLTWCPNVNCDRTVGLAKNPNSAMQFCDATNGTECLVCGLACHRTKSSN